MLGDFVKKLNCFSSAQYFDNGRWFRIPAYDFMCIVPIRESVLLSALHNILCLYLYQQQKDNNGFFPCSNKIIQKQVPFKDKEIQHALSILRSKKIIKTIQKGSKPGRYIFIDIEFLNNLINKNIEEKTKLKSRKNEVNKSIHTDYPNQTSVVESDHPQVVESDYPNQTSVVESDHPQVVESDHSIHYSKELETKKCVATALRPPKTQDSKYFKWAAKFAKVMDTIQTKTTNAKIITWSKNLKSINTIDKIPNEQIKKVLKWYCHQFDKKKYPFASNTSSKYLPPFVPVALCGRSFRTKFNKIEAAMHRDKSQAEKIKIEDPIIELTEHQKIICKRMKINFSNPTENITGWEELTKNIYEWKDKIINEMSECVERQEIKKQDTDFYQENIIMNRFLFDGYIMWINSEVRQWKDWGRDLKIFFAGEKHFYRYLNKKLRDWNFGPNRKMREILGI